MRYVNPQHPCGTLHPLPESASGGMSGQRQRLVLSPEDADPLFHQYVQGQRDAVIAALMEGLS
jgi:hypothetical protein